MDRIEMRKGISLLKGLLGGYALTIGLLLLLTLLVYRFRMPETGVHVGICTIYVLACFLAGLLCGRQMVNRRFLWWMLAGGLYFAVLFLASLIAGHQVMEEAPRTLLVLFLCTTSGMFGGMVL